MGDRPPVGGAVWCDQHRRAECVHLSKRTKQRCHQQAVSGTDTCWSHGGKTLAKLRAEGQVRLEVAAFALEARAEPVNEKEFLLELVGLARDRVLLVSRLLGEAFRAQLAGGEAGTVGPAGAGALVGHRYVLDRDGARVAVGEATRGLAAYEAEWVDRGARLAKWAVDAKLTDAQADVLAMLSGQLQGIIDSVLVGFGLDPADPEVVRVVSQRLALAAGGEEVDG
jgi:hypothetical protein